MGGGLGPPPPDSKPVQAPSVVYIALCESCNRPWSQPLQPQDRVSSGNLPHSVRARLSLNLQFTCIWRAWDFSARQGCGRCKSIEQNKTPNFSTMKCTDETMTNLAQKCFTFLNPPPSPPKFGFGLVALCFPSVLCN